jgi:hypothetical protein
MIRTYLFVDAAECRRGNCVEVIYKLFRGNHVDVRRISPKTHGSRKVRREPGVWTGPNGRSHDMRFDDNKQRISYLVKIFRALLLIFEGRGKRRVRRVRRRLQKRPQSIKQLRIV